MYTINDITAVIAPQYRFTNNAVIEHLIIDSRKVYFPQTSLFFALKGIQQDGHHYISDLYQKGLRHFVVSENIEPSLYPLANIVLVQNTLDALQAITAYHRKQFNYPVIGLTGSNGKTIIKEWLFQLLNEEYDIVRSPKSYNSQVGVPLSVWQMNDSYDMALFEAGISLPGEMEKLQKIIDPTIGIFTFLGEAHAMGFASRQEKVREKLKLFIHSEVLVYCADEPDVEREVQPFKATANPGLLLLGWSRKKEAWLQILATDKEAAGTRIQYYFRQNNYELFIPFNDEASVYNAITCIAILLHLQIPPNRIAEKMQQLRKVEMRLELKQGINNCSIINDSYNADINSLNIALDFLEQQHQHAKRTVVLSDLPETGQSAAVLYGHIAAMLQQKKVDQFIGIGPVMKNYQQLFDAVKQASFFLSTEAFLQNISSLRFSNETILLKGARVFQFEKISNALEQKMHQTLLEIDLNALRHNVKVYRHQLQNEVKLMCMVKAFSYGSGSHEIANLLQHAGVDYLGVAYADEGVDLRKAGIQLPIMVMNTEKAGFDKMIQYKLEPELYSFKILNAFAGYLQHLEIKHYPVHIKIDTGMHRLGFEEEDISGLCDILQTADCFTIKSVFSHLAAGGEAIHDAFTKQQHALLLAAAGTIEQRVGYTFMKHIANTSAIYRHPEMQMNMVRLGIGMYGVDADKNVHSQLKNVTTLKTTISQIKKLKKGESVGYGRSAIVDKDTVIATVRIGYADGYPRLLSNGVGHMLIHGQITPVIGRICMDMTMLDISAIPQATEEDEVIVFGESLPVSNLAKWAQTIEYEILTNISQRVKRVYFEE
jgi:Alr-MurF fusion protein